MYIYIYIYIYICVYIDLDIYIDIIYIYIERERERDIIRRVDSSEGPRALGLCGAHPEMPARRLDPRDQKPCSRRLAALTPRPC